MPTTPNAHPDKSRTAAARRATLERRQTRALKQGHRTTRAGHFRVE